MIFFGNKSGSVDGLSDGPTWMVELEGAPPLGSSS